jgi:hypothetical protein
MPHILYRAKNFPRHLGPLFIGKHSLQVRWEEMVWAAITMGKPGVAFLLSHGWHSIADMVVRSHTVYANLRHSSGFMEKSSLYGALDPTEKGATSYFMGMLAAKILGARLLGVPWLFHLSMLDSLGGYATLASNSEPDLVGLTRHREWVVAEAKGRTGGYSASAMTKAKLQTRQLRRINGQLPSLRVAVQAFFNSKMEWAMEDPDEFDESARDVDVDVNTVFERYYSAAIGATEQADARSLAGRKFFARTLSEIGVTVAVDAEVRARVGQREMAVDGIEVGSNSFSQVTEDGEFVVFPDGTAISLDARWAPHRMMQDPTRRRDG